MGGGGKLELLGLLKRELENWRKVLEGFRWQVIIAHIGAAGRMA